MGSSKELRLDTPDPKAFPHQSCFLTEAEGILLSPHRGWTGLALGPKGNAGRGPPGVTPAHSVLLFLPLGGFCFHSK